MKRKYLHIEIIDGELYIYADNKLHGAKTFTLEDIDSECNVGSVKRDGHFACSLYDFVT